MSPAPWWQLAVRFVALPQVCVLAVVTLLACAPVRAQSTSGGNLAPMGVTSTDVLRRYLDNLSRRHGFAGPDTTLLTRQELGQYFLQLMQNLSGLSSHELSGDDYQEIGFLTDEFEDALRQVKGRLAMQAFKGEYQSTAHQQMNARMAEHEERLKFLDRVQTSGEFVFAPQADFGKYTKDSMTANFRGRINILAKVHESKAGEKMGDGYLFTRLTAAAGRFFPQGTYLLSPENDVVDAVASNFNSGENETQVPGLVINNNNSNSLRPTVSMEQVYYTQDILLTAKLKANYKAGLVNFGAVYDANNYANNEAQQFLNTSFVNSIAWRPNFISPGTMFSLEYPLFRDKAFVRASAGLHTLTNRDYFGAVGQNAELQFGHKFRGKEGNARIGYWTYNFRRGSLNPYVTPTNLTGSAAMADLPGGTGAAGQPTGMYLNFDQKIWKNLGIWGRYAFNDKQFGQVYLGGLLSSRQCFSTGIEIPVSLFSKRRANDVIGIAYGQVAPYNRGAFTPASPAFVSLNGVRATTLAAVDQNLAQILGGNRQRNEKLLEAYYKFQLNKNVSFSPDVQYYWSPGGTGPNPGIFVLGSRMTVTF